MRRGVDIRILIAGQVTIIPFCVWEYRRIIESCCDMVCGGTSINKLFCGSAKLDFRGLWFYESRAVGVGGTPAGAAHPLPARVFLLAGNIPSALAPLFLVATITGVVASPN